MFWNLLLAHFLADYPLQSNWMVRNKKHAWVIGLHSAIQLAAMAVLLYPLSRRAWPALLGVTAAHFFIDLGKTQLGRWRPEWVTIPYLADQALHYGVLALAAWWLGLAGTGELLLEPRWAIYITAILTVTYVWFITERVIFLADEGYSLELQSSFRGRMLARLLLLGFAFAGMAGLAGFAGLAGVGAAIGIAGYFLYRSPVYRWRAIFTDLVVSVSGAIFIWLASGR